MGRTCNSHRGDPSSGYGLTDEDRRTAGSMLRDGATVGELAEHFGITIRELEPQIGITREGRFRDHRIVNRVAEVCR